MKKTVCILMSLLAVLTMFAAFAGKHADASAQTAEVEEIRLEDLCLDAQADTLGGSTGGAPILSQDDLAAFISDYEGAAE